MVSTGSYVVSALLLATLLGCLGFCAHRLRARLLPAWEGAAALLVEAVLAVSLLIWISELLGVLHLLYGWTLVLAGLALAGGAALLPRSAAVPPQGDRTRGPGPLELLVMVGVIGVVVAHWGLTVDSALHRGIFNFDSLWYHMPFAADIAQSHSVTGFHHSETVFANWFYPQNSELLHADGILIAHRDTLSLFLNFGWLGMALLAAWCIGRPWGRGHLSVAAVAVVLECHTLVVREPGAAKNDLATAAPLLAAIAILVLAWSYAPAAERRSRLVGWPLAAAGLAAGLAVGTKFTALAMAAALTIAVIAMAPAGRRWVAAGWWALPAFAAGGYWYVRNLVASGNPIPEITGLGPLSLPHPERLQSARPDFDIVHYATDTGVWSHYFGPGLHEAFGALWPLVLAAAAVAAVAAAARGRTTAVRWAGGAALAGMVAYVFTPLSAAGAEGAPTAFAINIRYAIPALLAGLALVPLPRALDSRRSQAVLLAALVVGLALTDRSDAVLRDPSRIFGVVLALLLVATPAALLALRARGAPGRTVAVGFAVLAVALLALGYPVERSYLSARFRNDVPREERIPGMGLDSAYRWASGVKDARIGLAGTTAGFLGYGFYGTDLSNRVTYLGEEGPHGAFDAIPSCAAFRAAVDAARLDYLVTSPFLNFLDTGRPVPSPEAGWLRGSRAVAPLLRSGPVTVWRVDGRLDPAACGPGNAPLRRVPDTPAPG